MGLDIIYDQALSVEQCSSAWIERLKADEKNNFSNFTTVLAPYVLAQLSNAVYEMDGGVSKKIIPVGFEVIATAHDRETGYYGAAYWSAVSRIMVIAHRGTKFSNLDSLDADIISIVRGKADKMMASADEFTRKLLESIEGKNNIICYGTGHSLGGWLAKIAAFHAEKRGIHLSTVVFDAPGEKDILEENLNRNNAIDLKRLDFTDYLSSPNPINCCQSRLSQSLGQMYRVFYKFPSWGGIKEFFSYTLFSHNMDNMVKALSDQSTKIDKMQDWPRVEFPAKWSSKWKLVNFFGAIKDYLFNSDSKEYKDLFDHISRGENYDLNQAENYIEQYLRENKSHYQLSTLPKNYCAFCVFNQREKMFLEDLALLKTYIGLERALVNIKTENVQLFNFLNLSEFKYQIQKDKGMVELLSAWENEQLVTVIHRLLQIYPELPKQVHEAMYNFIPELCDTVGKLVDSQNIQKAEYEEVKSHLNELKEELTEAKKLADSSKPSSSSGGMIGEVEYYEIRGNIYNFRGHIVDYKTSPSLAEVLGKHGFFAEPSEQAQPPQLIGKINRLLHIGDTHNSVGNKLIDTEGKSSGPSRG